jgi:hypothetical protein
MREHVIGFPSGAGGAINYWARPRPGRATVKTEDQ